MLSDRDSAGPSATLYKKQQTQKPQSNDQNSDKNEVFEKVQFAFPDEVLSFEKATPDGIDGRPAPDFFCICVVVERVPFETVHH